MFKVYGSICQEIQARSRKIQEEPDIYPSQNAEASLAKSLACGCRVCSIACKAVGEDVLPHHARLRADDFDCYYANTATVKDRLVVGFRKQSLYISRGGFGSEVFVLQGVEDSLIPVTTPISGDTGSEKCLETASRWLIECWKEHSVICPPLATMRDPPKLPKRVIDVDLPGTQNVRLQETNDSKGHYVCLSHCWGMEQPLKTTRRPNTLSQHLKEIQWGMLPKTFQDAIAVTRWFGFPYLWIDSLCIIQDDNADWEGESAKMADIYQNCVITIAGSASSNHSQGLFRKADSSHVDGCLFENVTQDGLQTIRQRKSLRHDTSDLPLMHRGWAFQERQMSPRFLHFGRHEVLWECMERSTCECGLVPQNVILDTTWPTKKNMLHSRSLKMMEITPDLISRAWRIGVSDYSRTALTFPNDIFPAISGVAKNVERATGWTYIAGLWKENLILDLIWKVEDPTNARRCKDWRAPTFSWASVIREKQDNRHITYRCLDDMYSAIGNPENLKINIHAEVEKTHCVPLGQDLTGRLESSYIILSGTLIEATIHYRFWEEDWRVAPKGKGVIQKGYFRMDFDFHDKDSTSKDGDSVFCLKMIGKVKLDAPEVREGLYHLVLRKLSKESGDSDASIEECEFERIGLLEEKGFVHDRRLEEECDSDDIQHNVSVKII